jgi:hypothetical protein
VIYLLGYILTIFGANWAIDQFGLVPVAPGMLAPAGVYFAGLAFTLRDLTQESVGRGWTFAGILVGALISGFVSPTVALASGAAFLFSETADFLVYTPLRERSWLGAILASNVVGFVADSALFLYLAFGSFDFLAGQLVGKAAMTVLAVGVLGLLRVKRAQVGTADDERV